MGFHKYNIAFGSETVPWKVAMTAWRILFSLQSSTDYAVPFLPKSLSTCPDMHLAMWLTPPIHQPCFCSSFLHMNETLFSILLWYHDGFGFFGGFFVCLFCFILFYSILLYPQFERWIKSVARVKVVWQVILWIPKSKFSSLTSLL